MKKSKSISRQCLARHRGNRLVQPWRRSLAFLIVAPTAALPVVGIAQEDGGSSATAAPAANSASPNEPAVGSTDNAAPGNGVSDYGLTSLGEIGDALGFSGSSFSPGFGTGCATADFNSSDLSTTTLRRSLQYAPSPANSGGHYLALSVAGSETYTDNLNRDSRNRKSDFITNVSPRLDACTSGSRLRADLSYQLQGLVYANNSQYNHIYNDLAANSTFVWFPGHLYFDANTRYGQQVVDPSLTFSHSNGLRPGNQTANWTTNLSPYLFQSLGPLGVATLRYRYGWSLNGDSNVPDSTVQAGYFTLSSRQTTEPLSYTLNASTQKVHRSGGNEQRFFRNAEGFDNPNIFNGDVRNRSQTSYFDRASLQLGYQLTRTLRLIGEGGVEDNYKPSGKNDRLSRPFWNAGVRWASNRNFLEARVGHRFYGTTYELEASHRARVFNARLGYTQKVTSSALNQVNSASSASSASYGFGTYGSAFGDQNNSLFDRGVYVQKQWTGDIGVNTALTETNFRGFHENRVYQTNGVPNDRRNGVSVDSRYHFAERMTLIPNVSWQEGSTSSRTSNGAERRKFRSTNLGVSLGRAISPSLQAAVGYAYSWGEGSAQNGSYTENRVFLQIQKGF